MQMDHYITEGVEHFFLIDDGSTDESHAVLEPYRQKGLITLMVDVRKDHDPPVTMVARYDLLFKPFYYLTTWMIHVDLDEFVYSRKTTLTNFLQNVDSNVGEIRIPWKNFGSSGHVSRPPGNVVSAFTQRAEFDVQTSMYLHTKSIFRVAATTHQDIHYVRLKPGYYSAFALESGNTGPPMHEWPLKSLHNPEWLTLPPEQILDSLGIHLNHYCLRWKDWFMAVKATRGGADREENVYDASYFTGMDRNEVIDNELSRKREKAAQE